MSTLEGRSTLYFCFLHGMPCISQIGRHIEPVFDTEHQSPDLKNAR